MAGTAQDVDAEGAHIQRQAARRLRRVQQHERAGGVREHHDVGDRAVAHGLAGEVGGVGHDDQAGGRRKQAGERARVQCAVRTGRNEVHRRMALASHAREGAQHGVVVPVGGDHVVTLAHDAADSAVERVGRVEEEAQAPGVGHAEKPGHDLAGTLDHAHGGQVGRMCAATVAAARDERLDHGIADLGRALQGGRGTVEVGHSETTLGSVAMISAMRYRLVTPPTPSWSRMP